MGRHMLTAVTHRVDTRVRILLAIVAVAAILSSFSTADNASLDRPERFAALTALALVIVVAGAPATDLVQGYTKRRPLRMRWGKPATELQPAVEGPGRQLPEDWHVAAGLRPLRLVAGLAAAASAVLLLGMASYALAGSGTRYGSGLLVYLALAVAVVTTVRFGFKILYRNRAVALSPDGVVLGPGVGYWPQLEIARSSILGIERSHKHEVLAFVTALRRYEVSTTMLDDDDLDENIAGLWPELTWHELSPSAVPTTLVGD